MPGLPCPRSLVLLLALSCATLAPVWAQRGAAERSATDLLREAKEAAEAGDCARAVSLLQEAIGRQPRSADAQLALGLVYEQMGLREEAVDAVGRALVLEPARQDALRHFQRLLLEGRFPRWARLQSLALGGISLVTDSCLAQTDLGDRSRRFAYTTSLIFPEEMGRTGAALAVKVPAAGAIRPDQSLANRVCYGLVARPDSEFADLRMALYYPSATVSRSGTDYSDLAPRLMHMLLRIGCYLDLILGRRVPATGTEPLRIWMAELGPSGAEVWDGSLYLYDVSERRTPLEWTRQVAHELGHYALPQAGRFASPEPYANGVLGERLAMQWLATEAGLLSGSQWPDEPARALLSKLWGAEPLDAAEYISQRCLGDIAFWLQSGPDSALLGGTGQDAFRYLVGFCLWIQAAHGPGLLRATLDTAAGPGPGDYVLAYKRAVERLLESGALEISAGGCNVPASRLAERPAEGALGWRDIWLGPGDTAVFAAYLPRGLWRIAVQMEREVGDLQIALDEGEPQPALHASPSQTEAGWHLVRVTRSGAGEAVRILGLQVSSAGLLGPTVAGLPTGESAGPLS